MSHYKNAIRYLINMMNNNKNIGIQILKIYVKKIENIDLERSLNFASSLFSLYNVCINSFSQNGEYYIFETDYENINDEKIQKIENERYILYFVYD